MSDEPYVHTHLDGIPCISPACAPTEPEHELTRDCWCGPTVEQVPSATPRNPLTGEERAGLTPEEIACYEGTCDCDVTAPHVPSVGHNQPTILAEAEQLVYGPRQEQYGAPWIDFSRTGRMWGAILEEWRMSDREAIDAHLVALCMAALKISRIVQTPEKRDSWVDLAGYAGAGHRCVDR